MTRASPDGEVVFRQEGKNVRAVAGQFDVLFPKSQKKEIIAAYEEWRPRVEAHFEPRWRGYDGRNIEEKDLRVIVREITLHWMGFCVMHREPVQMGAAEWDQPQTRRIIRQVVEGAFPRGSDEATALCAQLMGISPDSYLEWADADETFMGLM